MTITDILDIYQTVWNVVEEAFILNLPERRLHHDFRIFICPITVLVWNFLAYTFHACFLEICILAFSIYIWHERICPHQQHGSYLTGYKFRIQSTMDSGCSLFCTRLSHVSETHQTNAIQNKIKTIYT